MVDVDSHLYVRAPLNVAFQITSELPNGGLPPFSVISQVMNPNLNSDFLDGYHAIAFPRKAENAAITGSWSYTTAPTISVWGTDPNSVATYGQITALDATFNAKFDARFALKTTDNLAEGTTNFYFTQARVRATPLTGLSITSGTVSALDSVLSAIGKLQYQITNNVPGIELVSDFNVPVGNKTLRNAFNVNPANQPVGGQYGSGWQVSTNDDPAHINQLIFAFAGELFTRTKQNSVWGSYNRVITTGNMATLTRGTGLLGSNFSPYSAATFSVDFGTGASQVAAGNHTHTFASITSKPTTLAGYGITDAEPAFLKGSIIQGTGVTLTGTLTNRLVGTGDITVAMNTTYTDGRYFPIEELVSNFDTPVGNKILRNAFNVNPTNQPVGGQYGSGFQVSTNNDSAHINQFAWAIAGEAFTRTRYNSVWGSWARFITTANMATLTRGAGLTGTNFTPYAAATFAVDFGTGAGQVAAGNHTHAALTPGTGISGVAYTGGAAQTWTFDTTFGDARYFPKEEIISDFNSPVGNKVLRNNVNPANQPVGGRYGSGWQVSTNNDPAHINQLVFEIKGELYTRTRYNSVWGSWDRVLTNSLLGTHTRGNGLIGSNFTARTSTTWDVDFGTGTNQAARGDHTHTFASLTSKPTTLLGYGITDAANISHTHTASQITDFTTSARGTISGTGVISYNSTTGVISYTGGAGSGTIGGGGTASYVPVFSPGGSAIQNSRIYDTGVARVQVQAGLQTSSDILSGGNIDCGIYTFIGNKATINAGEFSTSLVAGAGSISSGVYFQVKGVSKASAPFPVGTRADRLALTSVAIGYYFFQTDVVGMSARGLKYYDGTQWAHVQYDFVVA